jgi:hypothetical protein
MGWLPGCWMAQGLLAVRLLGLLGLFLFLPWLAVADVIPSMYT